MANDEELIGVNLERRNSRKNFSINLEKSFISLLILFIIKYTLISSSRGQESGWMALITINNGVFIVAAVVKRGIYFVVVVVIEGKFRSCLVV